MDINLIVRAEMPVNKSPEIREKGQLRNRHQLFIDLLYLPYLLFLFHINI